MNNRYVRGAIVAKADVNNANERTESVSSNNPEIVSRSKLFARYPGRNIRSKIVYIYILPPQTRADVCERIKWSARAWR